jgi:MFS family permease
MIDGAPRQRVAWLVLLLIAVSAYGNFYVYDSIGPLADLLQRQRGFTGTQIGLLNAIYSLPNIVLIVVGGALVDRFGSGRVCPWTAAICLAGATLTAFSAGFAGMAAGRLLYGVGAETFQIGALAALARYFAAGRLGFAMACGLAAARAGSFSADMSPTWFAHAYAQGWQRPLVIAAVISATSLAAAIGYGWVDGRARGAVLNTPPPGRRFAFIDAFSFGSMYWLLLVPCVLWYSAMFAFRSTFAIRYFQHAYGLDLATAGAFNSCVFLAAMVGTPALGWLGDEIGGYLVMFVLGASLLPVSIALMMAHSPLWLATVLMGVSFSLVPAAIWPLTGKIVLPQRLGTAIGIMMVAQNVGIGVANFVAGLLSDFSGPSQNLDGYRLMMLFFGLVGTASSALALLMWTRAKHPQRIFTAKRTPS